MRARHRVHAVVVQPHFHHDAGDARQIVSVCPDIELRRHFLQETRVAGNVVEPTEGVPAGIVGESLRLQHGRRRLVQVHPRGHEALQLVYRALGRERRLDFVVIAETAVIVKAGVQTFQVDVPRQLDIVRACPRTVPVIRRLDLPRLHIAALVAQNLLRGNHPVRAGHQRGIAEKLEGEARRLHVCLRARIAVGGVDRGVVERRFDPLHEVG